MFFLALHLKLNMEAGAQWAWTAWGGVEGVVVHALIADAGKPQPQMPCVMLDVIRQALALR